MIIKNGLVFDSESKQFQIKDIFIKNQQFANEADMTDADLAEVVDAEGLYVIPGLIDVHSHGAAGFDFSDADPQGLAQILRYEKSCGITSYCPTTMTLDRERIFKIIDTLNQLEQKEDMAHVAGINMEGPFLDAKKKGYCETMFGRRRPVPELKSSNFMQRSFGERVAMNSPIQGTAADIIKYAMVNVYDALKSKGLKSKLILQIHDELLIETVKDEVEQVREVLSHEMQNACSLAVKLEIDLHTGTDWYEAK